MRCIVKRLQQSRLLNISINILCDNYNPTLSCDASQRRVKVGSVSVSIDRVLPSLHTLYTCSKVFMKWRACSSLSYHLDMIILGSMVSGIDGGPSVASPGSVAMGIPQPTPNGVGVMS